LFALKRKFYHNFILKEVSEDEKRKEYLNPLRHQLLSNVNLLNMVKTKVNWAT